MPSIDIRTLDAKKPERIRFADDVSQEHAVEIVLDYQNEEVQFVNYNNQQVGEAFALDLPNLIKALRYAEKLFQENA